MDLLTAQLDEYNKHGVSKFTDIQLHCDLAINEEGTILSLYHRSFSENKKTQNPENS